MGQSTRRLPVGTVIAGLVLIAVPTAFAIFSEAGTAELGVRVAVAVGWVAAALIVGVQTARRDQTRDAVLGRLSAEQAEEQRERVIATFDTLVAPLLRRSAFTRIPSHYRFTIYVEDGGWLVPLWPFDPDLEPLLRFAPGNGATGTAWATGDLTVVTGETVSDPTYGLTPEQQQHFTPYSSVVAAPMSDRGLPIGVLTAISTNNDGYFDEQEEARERFRDLAAILGPVVGAVVSEGGGTVTP